MCTCKGADCVHSQTQPYGDAYWHALHLELTTGTPISTHWTYRPVEQRFWDRLLVGQPQECWLWQGTLVKSKGYGQMVLRYQCRTQPDVKRIKMETHRLCFMIWHKLGRWELPPVVRHTCDVRPCCNPHHLLPGTAKDNIYDAIERKRLLVHGEHSPLSKLTQAQVDVIKLSIEPAKALAESLGVHPSTISNIRSGRTWRGIA